MNVHKTYIMNTAPTSIAIARQDFPSSAFFSTATLSSRVKIFLFLDMAGDNRLAGARKSGRKPLRERSKLTDESQM